MERSLIVRHRTRRVSVGDVTVGGGTPIVVQSMTNTDTADVAADDYVRPTWDGEPRAPHLDPEHRGIARKSLA